LYNDTPSKPVYIPGKLLPRLTLNKGKPLSTSGCSTNLC